MTGQLCGAWATHVDHLVARTTWPASVVSSLTRAGSTARWRRVRTWVLGRDGHRCQLPVDGAGNYDAQADTAPDELDPHPAHPDDPSNLRAACALHNLQRGAGDRRPAANRPRRRRAGRAWEWPA